MKEQTKGLIMLFVVAILFVSVILITKFTGLSKSVNTEVTESNTQSTSTTTSETTTTTTVSTTKKVVKTTKKKRSTFKKVATASKAEYMAYAKSLGNYNDTQMQCLDYLWIHESGWNPNSYYKGACGIPQSKPCNKIYKQQGSYDWDAQIRWGVNYILNRYGGDPCSAWNHFKNHKPHWY